MQLIRSIKDRANPYVQINKQVFNDSNLSLKAKGFIGHCLSQKDGWEFHVSQLCTVLREGERAIYSTITECIDQGYAFRFQIRKNGAISGCITIISDSKEEIERVKKETAERLAKEGYDKAIVLKKRVPHRGFVDVGNVDVEKRGSNKNKSKKEERTTTTPTPSSPPISETQAATQGSASPVVVVSALQEREHKKPPISRAVRLDFTSRTCKAFAHMANKYQSPKWLMESMFIRMLTHSYSIPYIEEQIRYMIDRHVKSLDDEKTMKKNKCPIIENPKNYLSKACSENYAGFILEEDE
jgi:hypothetical protein